MANLQATVNIKDTETFKELLGKLTDLVTQVEINDYKDNLGHELKANKAYTDFKELICRIN